MSQKPKWLAVGLQSSKYQTRSQRTPSLSRNRSVLMSEEQSKQLLKNRSQNRLSLTGGDFIDREQESIRQTDEDKVREVGLQRYGEKGGKVREQVVGFSNDVYIKQKTQQQKKIMQVDAKYDRWFGGGLESKQREHGDNGSIQYKSKVHNDESAIMIEGAYSLGNSDSFGRVPVIKIDSDQSQILESVSFVKETHNDYNGVRLESNNAKYIQTKDRPVQTNDRYAQNNHTAIKCGFSNIREEVVQKLREVKEISSQMKIIHQTVIKQISGCRSSGNRPLYLNNGELSSKIMSQLYQLSGLCGRNDKLQRQLQVRSLQVTQLRAQLKQRQRQLVQRQEVLISKMEVIGELRERLGRGGVGVVEGAGESNRGQGELQEMRQRLQHLSLRNGQLQGQIRVLEEERCQWQQEKFNYEQESIGLELQVERRLHEQLPIITRKIQQQLRVQRQRSQQQQNTNNNTSTTPPSINPSPQPHPYYLQTIQTLTQQITDLTLRCQQYQQYIRQRQAKTQKVQQLQVSKTKEYENYIREKMKQLQEREVYLVEMEQKMRVRENRGKEVEGKLAVLEKREKVLRVKEDEIEKYLQELNHREEELYLWEKALGDEDQRLNDYGKALAQQDAKLSQKTTQLQRDRSILQNQKLTFTQQQQQLSLLNRNIPNYPQPLYLPQAPQPYYPLPASTYSPPSYIPQPPATTYPHPPTIVSKSLSNHGYSHQPAPQSPQLDQRQKQLLNQIEGIKSSYGQSNKDKNQAIVHYERELTENGNRQKYRTESMKVRPGSIANNQQQYYQNQYSRNQRLYMSTAYDKKSQLVEEILARRRNDPSRIDVKSNKTPLNDLFKKADFKRAKSPIRAQNNDLSRQNEKKLKQKFQSRRLYQKPSKDLPQMYRPTTPVTLNNAKRAQLNNKEVSMYTEKSSNIKQFAKSTVPGMLNINQKLQKLKQQIKREVKALE